MSLVKDGAKLIGFLFVASILGGVLGGFGDMAMPSIISGTPLGPRSDLDYRRADHVLGIPREVNA